MAFIYRFLFQFVYYNIGAALEFTETVLQLKNEVLLCRMFTINFWKNKIFFPLKDINLKKNSILI